MKYKIENLSISPFQILRIKVETLDSPQASKRGQVVEANKKTIIAKYLNIVMSPNPMQWIVN